MPSAPAGATTAADGDAAATSGFRQVTCHVPRRRYPSSEVALARDKTLKRVLSDFSPTFPGFYLYYPSRRQQPSKLKAFVDFVLERTGKH
jgi:DNA-binding transcriptional LysR family regulator